MANQIAQTFPRESPSNYYTPGRTENGITLNPMGKLYWHCDYLKLAMFEDGILEKRGKKLHSETQNEIEVADSIKDKLKQLHRKVEPWNDVVLWWEDTFDARRSDMISTKLPVKDYMTKYACLAVNKALDLYEGDFRRLYPDCVLGLSKHWEQTVQLFYQKLKSIPIGSASDRTLRDQIPTTTSEHQIAIIFHLLPYLIPASRPRRKRKSNTDNHTNIARKLSLQERREAFFVHILNVLDLEL
ncbi:uncharacterized protein [Fopius arisanus]|uniref:Uncharacterized protein n=2 Tax=Fopius arisanus TaxID=64838 RepID=A0A9R1TLF7_9HYME|nr:PREDICTED: uncharacterized protein LOC105272479 [Fopius arisanus]